MIKISTLRLVSLMIVLLLSITACTPVGTLIGAGAAVGGASLQERGIEGVVDDEVIEANLSSKLFQKDVNLFNLLTVEVYEGRALLIGYVPTAEMRLEAVRTAWDTKGVQEVINEIEVGDGPSFSQAADDVVIANSIRAELLLKKDIDAINYSIEVENGVVYLLGVARHTAELEAVTNIARYTNGVKRVVSYVRVKNSAPSVN